jgi:hypothetical protein
MRAECQRVAWSLDPSAGGTWNGIHYPYPLERAMSGDRAGRVTR